MFQTQSGKALRHLGYQVGLFFNYSKDALVLRDVQGNRVHSIMEHQIGLDLVAAIGFFNILELGLALPLTLYQVGSIPDLSVFGATRNTDVSGFAAQDLKIQVKGHFLKQKQHFINLGASVYLGVPMGDSTRFNGEGGVSFGLAVMASRQFLPRLNIALNLGYRYLPRSEFLNVIVEHELFYSLGAQVKIVHNLLDLIGEFTGAVNINEKTSAESAPLDFYVGGRIYPLRRMDLAINVGMGFGIFYPGFGSPQVRVLLGVTWSPRDFDTDKDGLVDRIDACPKVPGPKENKGCPWGDKDNDGIKDNVDKCPTVPGPKENNGCPWGDKDKDGITDNVDKCPTVPGPKENNGCPWGDRDKDGIKDNVDRCPSKPGPKENNGCPWGDRDKDGITDNVDRCPDKPGPSAFKGCPDSDNDRIPDPDDKCPYVKGLPNTKDPSKHGCPKVILVKVTKDEIKILQKVYFATASSRIRRRSYKVLDQVVEVLKSRKKIRVRVEGHTDNRGGKTYNKRLSQRRAASVRRYLVRKGIDAGRLKSEGYGLEKPIASNKTRKGRAKNRRVQFKILKEGS